MNKTIYTPQSECLRLALATLRHKAGLTQRQLAERLGREHSFIARLEQGERRLDLVEFYWLCKACDADPVRAAREIMKALDKVCVDQKKG